MLMNIEDLYRLLCPSGSLRTTGEVESIFFKENEKKKC
jgi:hypothetical protein